MKISKKETIETIKSTCQVAAKNGSFAALSNVAIEVEDRVKLTCGDGQVQVNSYIDADIDVAFSTTVNAQKFSTAINSCNENIEIFCQHDLLVIKSGRKKYELKTMNIDSYPAYPEDELKPIDVTSEELINGIKSVTHFMGKDDARYYMNGVAINENGVQASLKGHTFAWNRLDLGIEIIVPYDSVNAFLSQDLSNTKVLAARNLIRFESDDFTITSVLIDGTFPNVKRALPTTEPVTISIDGDEIRNSIKAIEFINDGFIQLKSSNGELEISAESKVKDTAQDFIGFDGDDLEFRIEPSYFKKLIAATTDQTININYWSDRNMIICEEDNLTQIVMTIK